MKRAFLVTLAIVGIIAVSSCSKKEQTCTITENDGIICYENNNTPSNSNETINTKLLYEITGNKEGRFGHPFALAVDNDTNLYVLDVEKCLISKFNDKGIFVTSFGGSGTGPGESIFPNNIAIINDTVMVSSMSNRLLNKYSLEGKFLYSTKMVCASPIFVKPINNGKNVIGFTESVIEGKNSMKISVSLSILNSSFAVFKTINEHTVDFDPQKSVNFLDLYAPYAAGNGKVFVSQNNDRNYAIDIYDSDGKRIEKISKNYASVRLSQEEKNEFNESLKRVNDGNNPPISATYKKPINNIFFDKYKRLLHEYRIKKS
ncbi:MAG: 6-bladed beta-propeller [Candidatus Delongbacteria bacterium]|nr:6-bladed beta-propeller [Candidatus Delongbacteria bacterium]MCG2760160.1 6-bladed beta-propeller [Candidatus Delongbacteria bacterium]